MSVCLQVDLGRLHRVCGVATQGIPAYNRDYIQEYKMGWSKDKGTWETNAESMDKGEEEALM